MSRSLAVKLTLAFLLVALAGAALTALFARWLTWREFDQLVLDQVQSDFVADVQAFYETRGSWEGATLYFGGRAMMLVPHANRSGEQPPARPGIAPSRALLPGTASRASYVFALADQIGRVILPAGDYALDAVVPPAELAKGVPIQVDGQVVATAMLTGQSPELSSQEIRYLNRTNRSSLYAAVAAVIVSLMLGILLARTLTRPVRELTTAAHEIAEGKMWPTVPVRSQDELGELAAAFNRMSADLAQANNLRRQMMADIAHDLRTPLTVMAGYLEAMRDGVLVPTAKRFDTMHREAQHLRRLVEDLRTLSLADAGELTLNREMVPPISILTQMAAVYQHKSEQAEIDLQVQAAPGLPAVHVDPDRMVQVLGNLVSNALRHTKAGGSLQLGAEADASSVRLWVQDNGAGMTAAQVESAFNRFCRGGAAQETHEGGSGLGLAIAKSLVELQGGRIAIESALGEGTTVSVWLPIMDE